MNARLNSPPSPTSKANKYGDIILHVRMCTKYRLHVVYFLQMTTKIQTRIRYHASFWHVGLSSFLVLSVSLLENVARWNLEENKKERLLKIGGEKPNCTTESFLTKINWIRLTQKMTTTMGLLLFLVK